MCPFLSVTIFNHFSSLFFLPLSCLPFFSFFFRALKMKKKKEIIHFHIKSNFFLCEKYETIEIKKCCRLFFSFYLSCIVHHKMFLFLSYYFSFLSFFLTIFFFFADLILVHAEDPQT